MPKALSSAANSLCSSIAGCQVPKPRCLSPAAHSLDSRIAGCQLPKPRCLSPAAKFAAAALDAHRGYGPTSARGFRLIFPEIYGSVHRAVRPPARQLGGTSVPTPTQGLLGRSHPVAEQARQLPPSSRGLAPHGMWQPLGVGEAPPGAARPDQAAALGHSPGRGLPRPKLVAARRRLLAERAGPRLLALRGGPDRRRDPILGRPHSALIIII